jgi:DNA-binding transcriptional ArsR family regulator
MARRLRGADDPIRTVARIALLASAVRQDILDSVDAIGPCSVAELAQVLGRGPHGLYHHIRRLEKARLIRLERTRGADGRARVELAVDRRQWLEYRPGDERNRKAVLRVVLGMMRSAQRHFGRAFRPGLAVVAGPRRNLWAARARGVLSAHDLETVNTLLRTLLARFGGPRRSVRPGRMHEITFVLSPVAGRRGAVPSRSIRSSRRRVAEA